jgi:hypothetical protein
VCLALESWLGQSLLQRYEKVSNHEPSKQWSENSTVYTLCEFQENHRAELSAS